MFKYKIITLFLLLLSISLFDYSYAKERNYSLKNKIIYIDPGHGGNDPGAMYKDVLEKDINLEISKLLKNELNKKGGTVYLTRTGDYDLSVPNTINNKRSDLSRRSNVINKSNCDLFLSIHLNAESSSSWHGAQVFYNSKLEENEKIAKIFQKLFKEKLNSDRDYKKDNTLYLQNRITRPGVLLELGFLSNPNERYLLQTDNYQKKIVNIIIEGIETYLNGN